MIVDTITVCQPYAQLLVLDEKRIETRPKLTHKRGTVAIHAGLKSWWRFIGCYLQTDIMVMLYHHGFLPEQLPHGAVIGTVDIVDCIPVEELAGNITDRERTLGDYSPGRYGWILENPVLFDQPVPAEGKQGWWKWEVPTQ